MSLHSIALSGSGLTPGLAWAGGLQSNRGLSAGADGNLGDDDIESEELLHEILMSSVRWYVHRLVPSDTVAPASGDSDPLISQSDRNSATTLPLQSACTLVMKARKGRPRRPLPQSQQQDRARILGARVLQRQTLGAPVARVETMLATTILTMMMMMMMAMMMIMTIS